MPCVKHYTKKYLTRSSPPYPANQCAGDRKKGNDGQWYRSKAASNGIHRWQLEATKQKSTIKSRSSAAKSSSKHLKKGGRYLLKLGRGLDVKAYYIGTFGKEVCFGETKENTGKGVDAKRDMVEHQEVEVEEVNLKSFYSNVE